MSGSMRMLRIASVTLDSPRTSRSCRRLSMLAHRTPLVCPVSLCQRQLMHRCPRIELPQPDAEHAVQSLPTAALSEVQPWLIRSGVLFQQRSFHPTTSLQPNTHVVSNCHDTTCESKQLRCDVMFAWTLSGLQCVSQRVNRSQHFFFEKYFTWCHSISTHCLSACYNIATIQPTRSDTNQITSVVHLYFHKQ